MEKKHYTKLTFSDKTEIFVPTKRTTGNTLYEDLLNVTYTTHVTNYSAMHDSDLWFMLEEIAPWDNPIQALQEAITRSINRGVKGRELGYSALSFIYNQILADERFCQLFDEEEMEHIRYSYDEAERLVLEEEFGSEENV
jgi:hypothetical protein